MKRFVEFGSDLNKTDSWLYCILCIKNMETYHSFYYTQNKQMDFINLNIEVEHEQIMFRTCSVV